LKIMLARLALVTGFLFLLPGIYGCATTSETANEIERLNKEVAYLKRQVAVLNRQVEELSGGSKVQRRPHASLSVSFAGNPKLGNKDAKIAMVEFSDYQCPFCRRYHGQTFDRIKQRYVDNGKLLYVYRDFPLPSHRQAPMASVAANCAGQQGAYWEMLRALYLPSAQLNRGYYLSIARRLGLRLEKFESCLADSRQLDEVSRDTRYGASLGIRGTPAFFIGRIDGEKIVDTTPVMGAQPLSVFVHAIDQVLARVE
jgi:protein-disulfide isomerase